jgi:hypothetical protein
MNNEEILTCTLGNRDGDSINKTNASHISAGMTWSFDPLKCLQKDPDTAAWFSARYQNDFSLYVKTKRALLDSIDEVDIADVTEYLVPNEVHHERIVDQIVGMMRVAEMLPFEKPRRKNDRQPRCTDEDWKEITKTLNTPPFIPVTYQTPLPVDSGKMFSLSSPVMPFRPEDMVTFYTKPVPEICDECITDYSFMMEEVELWMLGFDDPAKS